MQYRAVLIVFAASLANAQTYTISTVAGGGTFMTSGQATAAEIGLPSGLAVDGAGNLYIADGGFNVVWKVTTNGAISIFAGTVSQNSYSGDGGPATSAGLPTPAAVAVDSPGNVYIATWPDGRIRKVAPSGIITTVAGGAAYAGTGYGDGGPAVKANLAFPQGVAVDTAGNLYIADFGNSRVRKVGPDGIITTVAGGGAATPAGGISDGGSATSAFIVPWSVAVDSSGNLLIADTGNNRIRKVSNGVITTIAGSGAASFSGDGGPATQAGILQPKGVAIDSSGNILISDTGDNRVRMVGTAGTISTIAGNGVLGTSGDGGPGASAELVPYGIAFGPNGKIYVADIGGHGPGRVRLLTPSTGGVPGQPAVNPNGVVPVFSSSTTVTPGSWISIYGSNLAPATATWTGNFPTSLGDVTVTIDSKPAYLWFVSPGQINAQVPDDSNTGLVPVVVTTPAGAASSTVTLGAYSPSFSMFTARYPAAIVATPGQAGNSGAGYDVIGPSGAFSFSSRPVRAGEILILYGVGFGPTNPAVPAGRVFTGAAPMITQPAITIGGLSAAVQFAGIIEAGLYQFNVVVPALPSGDQPLVATINNASTQPNVFVTVQ